MKITIRKPIIALAVLSALACLASTLLAQGPVFATLHSFSGPDGAKPWAGVILGQDGNLYGSTTSGGAYNQGTVFKFTTGGVLTTIFTATGGSSPYDPTTIIQGTDGNLYVVIDDYPIYDSNLLLRGTTSGTFTIFAIGTSNDHLDSYLVQASDGYFYGLSGQGGTSRYVEDQYGEDVGCGSLYRIDSNGVMEILFSFNGTNGNCAGNPLIQASDGNLYGMTMCGGIGFVAGGYKSAYPSGVGSGYGTIFKWSSNGTLTTLHDFDGSNGCGPQFGLAQASDGSFYGATVYGGIGFDASQPAYLNGNGIIFKITSDGSFTSLYQFTGGNDGANPVGTLVQAGDGNFYGTTVAGGSNNLGTVFSISPGGVFASLFSFNGANGADTSAMRKFALGNDGNLYGTTVSGGANNLGTIFHISNITPMCNTPPVITDCPGSVMVNTGPGRVTCDQVANWTPPTIGQSCSPVTLVSNHNPGDTFPVGTNIVTYTATDTAGNSNICAFTVTVLDTTLPNIGPCPPDLTSNATSPAGAVVSFQAPAASDNCSLASVTTAPLSGSTFPVGTNQVVCTATDSSGNVNSCVFNVIVLGPADQISALTNLVQAFNFTQGIQNSLDAKLQNAEAAFDSAKSGAMSSACGALGAFINEAMAQSGNKITANQANQLITAAKNIENAIGCP